jgi:hypothetical protein
VDDCIWRRGIVGPFVVLEAVVTCEGIEDLSTVCEVGLEGEDAGFWVGEVSQVDVENFVALLDEFWNAMAPSFSRTTSEYNALSVRRHVVIGIESDQLAFCSTVRTTGGAMGEQRIFKNWRTLAWKRLVTRPCAEEALSFS